MPSFAKKATNIRADLERSNNRSGGAGWMRTIKDKKDLRVRFLQDPEDWLQYREHYSRSTGFFPCIDDDTCGGCASEDEKLQRKSTRYVAQVLIQHEEGAKDIGEVKALKIPSPLANRLVARADRNGGTLLNRDYTIIRRGSGLDTEYDVESEDKAPLDLSKYQAQFADVGAILEQQFTENAPPSPQARPTLRPVTEDEEATEPPF
jgi:hypothetical protein